MKRTGYPILIVAVLFFGCNRESAQQHDTAAAALEDTPEMAAEEAEWDVVIDEDTRGVRAADARLEVQGALLGAGPGDTGSELIGEDPGTGKMIRNIPTEAFHSVTQTEAALGMQQDALTFAKTDDGTHFKVTFGQLGSFLYEMPDPADLRDAPDPYALLKDQIPPEIKELDSKPVLLLGFMVPVEFDDQGKLIAFAITQNQAFCCYGVTPAMNDWVMVTLPEGQSTEYRQQEPIAVYGTFAVGEELDDGYVLSLYRLAATEVLSMQQLLRRLPAAS